MVACENEQGHQCQARHRGTKSGQCLQRGGEDKKTRTQKASVYASRSVGEPQDERQRLRKSADEDGGDVRAAGRKVEAPCARAAARKEEKKRHHIASTRPRGRPHLEAAAVFLAFFFFGSSSSALWRMRSTEAWSSALSREKPASWAPLTTTFHAGSVCEKRSGSVRCASTKHCRCQRPQLSRSLGRQQRLPQVRCRARSSLRAIWPLQPLQLARALTLNSTPKCCPSSAYRR
mmetsp:Transcript_22361/g.68846  ORF Transcript_22361/g.68846 Transcript_22361/m.68846 type:complete len:233 (-) Transcript_22361:99-797(-)